MQQKPRPFSPRTMLIVMFAFFVVFQIFSVTGIVRSMSSGDLGDWVKKGFGPALVVYLASRPNRREMGIMAAIGAIISLAIWPEKEGLVVSKTLHVASAFGFASIGVLIARAALSQAEERQEALRTLGIASIVPVYIAAIFPALFTTAVFHPSTYDAALFHLDVAIGAPAFVVARWYQSIAAIKVICGFVYAHMPLAVTLVYALHVHAKDDRAIRHTFESFVGGGIIAYIFYHACPAAGPLYAFGQQFPKEIPTDVPAFLMSVSVAPRNCMPSMHTAWILMLCWQAYKYGLAARVFSGFWLVGTLLATLGRGEHYLVDLAAGVGMAVFVDALFDRTVPLTNPARKRAIVVGLAFVIAWVFFVRWIPPTFVGARAVILAFIVVSVVVPLFMRRQYLAAVGAMAPQREVPEEIEAPAEPEASAEKKPIPREYVIAAVFFCSGFAGLVYEVVFGKSLALTFGSTARATTTVLATYMAGTALGSWVGGRIGSKRGDPLQVYALSELAIALWCALTPVIFSAIQHIYVAIAASPDPGPPNAALQIGLGAIAIFPATFLMGVTMPVLSRAFLADGNGVGHTVSMLYGANTLGAALGALLTGYFILPFFGVTFSTLVAVMLNLLVALFGMRLAKTSSAAPKEAEEAPTKREVPIDTTGERPVALLILFGGGLITLALEVVYTHLLAVVAGTSAYAFSLMLFAFLVGLGLGAALMRQYLRKRASSIRLVGMIELALAASILLGVFVWEGIPEYFASFDGYSLTTTFGAREVIRLASCCLVMIPPAVIIGALYPAAMECACRGVKIEDEVSAVGRAAMLNTIGNVLGAGIGSFLLLPRLGSLRSLHVLAGMAIVLGLAPLAVRRARTITLPALAAGVAVIFALQPKQFDLTRLASGANVYFSLQPYGKVFDHAESSDGGLTTMAEAFTKTNKRIVTMLTNGKFQGDDGPERKAQYGFALAPLLHTTARGNALVIGFGTGMTARVVRDAGYARTDVVELSADILHFGNKYFGEVNDHVLQSPNVHTYINDGRNFLLLSQRSYDLVNIEISSIWFAGAASLYNQEFYEIVKNHLTPGGVLMQWIQLHRLPPQDLISIITTLKSVLPNVSLYFIGSQGMLAACNGECADEDAALKAIESTPALMETLKVYEGLAQTIKQARLLDAEDIDRLLEAHPEAQDLISTDDNLFLEYDTPRANVQPYGRSLAGNIRFLQSFGKRKDAPKPAEEKPNDN